LQLIITNSLLIKCSETDNTVETFEQAGNLCKTKFYLSIS